MALFLYIRVSSRQNEFVNNIPGLFTCTDDDHFLQSARSVSCQTSRRLGNTLLIFTFPGTVIQIARFDTWKGFHANAAWLFTTGLAISATVDFAIAASLIWYLRRSRTGFAR